MPRCRSHADFAFLERERHSDSVFTQRVAATELRVHVDRFYELHDRDVGFDGGADEPKHSVDLYSVQYRRAIGRYRNRSHLLFDEPERDRSHQSDGACKRINDPDHLFCWRRTRWFVDLDDQRTRHQRHLQYQYGSSHSR